MSLQTPIVSGHASIFLHIPKTGGTTLRRIIDRQYRAEDVYTVGGSQTRESLAAFKQLPEEQRARLRVIQGHMPFGLHHYLPQPSVYITVVREPVARAVSFYHHIRNDTQHHLHEALVDGQMGLEAFLLSGISKVPDNGYVRLLSVENVDFGQCTADMLDVAKSRIEQHFAVVGVMERFDESVALMARTFGWRVGAYARQNTGKYGSSRQTHTEDVFQAIEDLNHLDIELYRWVCARFECQLQGQGWPIRRDIARLRLANRLMGVYSAARQMQRG